jgi:rubrerythrin
MFADSNATPDELREMIEVVLLAIPREIAARELYLSAAKKSKNEAAKKMFLTLAEQEKGHEKWLREILAEMKGKLAAGK